MPHGQGGGGKGTEIETGKNRVNKRLAGAQIERLKNHFRPSSAQPCLPSLAHPEGRE